MSIFVPSNCNVEGDIAVSHLAWSQNDQLVAMSAFALDDKDQETNQILFSSYEGELFPGSEIVHEYEATVISWHPTDKIVAIGWADGMISIWSMDGRTRPISIYSNSNQHHGSITLIKWNMQGRRLISGDKNGVVCIWSADARGNLTATKSFKKNGGISSFVFCEVPNSRSKNQQTRGKGDAKTSQVTSFFFGTDKGTIVYADDRGHCTDVFQQPSGIDHLLYFEEKARLVAINSSFLLTQYQVSDDGKLARNMQIKLSVSSDYIEKGIKSFVWAGPGILAMATHEKLIRFFDLAADESYNISLTNALGGFVDRSDRVCHVAFSPVDRYLAAGTYMGIVSIWKYSGAYRDLRDGDNITATGPSDWELIFRISLGSPILQLAWFSGRGSLAAVTEDETIFLNESIMYGKVCGDLYCVQDNATDLMVYMGEGSESARVNTGIQIRGLAVGRSCFVVWSGKVAKVYRVDPNSHRIDPLEPIKSTSTSMAIADSSFIVDEAWFVAEGSSVKIYNFMGTQKGHISFSEAEGNPVHIDINGRFLAVITNKGCIKIINVHTPTKPKLLTTGYFFSAKSLIAGDSNFHLDSNNMKLRDIKVNSSGTMVSVLCDQVESSQKVYYPDTKLYIYDSVRGAVSLYEFSNLRRFPVSIFWDETDDRLLSCEAHKIRDRAQTDPSNRQKLSSMNGVDDKGTEPDLKSATEQVQESGGLVEVYLLFATSDQGILMQDSVSSDENCGSLIGFNVPKIFYRKVSSKAGKLSEDQEFSEHDNISGNNNIVVKVMRDFVGMNNVNDVIKSALLDFSFYLTLGKLDEAYRVVKEINSPAIWENMAQMCVKTKRLDVAEVCLGNMGNARGAAAVREAKKEGNLEVTIGVLAIQLGLLDDAAALFREAGRYDMLNKLYQAAGFWDKAIKIAESKDRIHLKSTHFRFAKYLESVGQVEDAIEHFELSQNSRTEVPRMLFHLGKVEELGEYVMKSDDAALAKWWASYLESIDRLDKAKKFYSKAKDYLSLVRIYCFKGDLQKAAEIITETNDRASAYHFARQLENQGEFQESINFYAMSGCYNHSIRLAREHNLDSELMRFALKSTPALMIECAQHFESKEEYDKAVQLYHKGGDIPRALDLCFRVGENPKHPHAAVAFDMLNMIAQELGVGSSPQTLARCADFLVTHRQYEKAIDLYVMAKRYLAAVEMCLQQRVSINDEMTEKLTPPETMDAGERREILKDLAKALKKQGAFTLASKKYTQAGDRVRAIKCLVRSGDTKAVIQFASISRNSEIYTLAANYLQQMNWRESMDIMKAIIMFYTKAKAFMQLAGFYDSCAQVEIDEYRDYEKALGALNEALKYLSKDNSRPATELSKSVEKRLLLIEKFVEAKTCSKKDPSTMIAICEALLQDPMIEEAIRVGDCLGMLIDFFYQNGNMQDAYHYLREMDERKIQPFPYVEQAVVDEIHRAVGVSKVSKGKSTFEESKDSINMDEHISKPSRKLQSDVEEDEMEEEIDEEIEEDVVQSPAKGRNGSRNSNNYYGRK